MTHDLTALTTTLLANHITIRFPWLDATEGSPATNTKNRPRLGNRLIVLLHLLDIRSGLDHPEHRQFIYRMVGDEAGRWTIHFFFADESAIPVVASLTNGVVEPGQPANPDAMQFVEHRLEHLNKLDRLIGREPWWDHEHK
jgi:hypothetical protein